MKFLYSILALLLPVIAAAQFVQEAQEGKFKFRVQYSFGTTNNLWQRQFQNYSVQSITQSLEAENIIRQNADHGQMMSALGQYCKGKSMNEVMGMAMNFGGRFSEGYDYNRLSGPGHAAIVPSKDVWDAYRNRLVANDGPKSAGVCRDIASALSEFLLQCGIPKNRISIESIQVHGAGHQIVNVLGEDKSLYSINYSEVYKAKYDPFFSAGTETSFLTTGIQHTRYDAETGKVVDKRLTELGHILMAVTGGKVDSPDYIPELLQAEANYGVISAGAYMSSTQRGDLINGVKMAYDQRPLKWLHLSAGITYANSKLDGNFSQSVQNGYGSWNAEENLIFFQIGGDIDIPDIQILKSEDKKFFIDTNLSAQYAGSAIQSQVNYDNKKEWGYDHFNVIRLETGLVYDSKTVSAKANGGIEVTVNDKTYNTQVADHLKNGYMITPFIRGEYFQGELTLKGSKLQIKAGGRAYFYSYGGTQKYYLSFLLPKSDSILTLALIRQTDVVGNKYDYGSVNLQQRINLSHAGDLNLGVSAMGTLNAPTPDWRIMSSVSYSMKPKAPYRPRRDLNP